MVDLEFAFQVGGMAQGKMPILSNRVRLLEPEEKGEATLNF